jgi:hypothetical protein
MCSRKAFFLSTSERQEAVRFVNPASLDCSFFMGDNEERKRDIKCIGVGQLLYLLFLVRM